jgi:elongation factor G
MPEKRKLENIRNIGIMAHIDAGKTTTTERILYHSGKIHKIGEVHEGKAQMDYMDQEQERGITIQSAATTVYWKEHQINIIDTPGHVDFTAEVERSLRVLDGGIVVIDGQAGVESQTETVWQQANKYHIPRLIFVNKMDKMGANFSASLVSIEKKLTASFLTCQLPIGAEDDLRGIIDLIEEKAYYFQPGDTEENFEMGEIPVDYVDKVKEYRQYLVEKVIEYDEEIASKYLVEGQKLTPVEIRSLIRKATLTGKNFPVFCGTAFKNVGIKLLLDGIVNYLPSPRDIPQISVFVPGENSPVQLEKTPNLPLALAFKIVIDKYNNKLVFFRVYSGKLTANSYVYNVTRQKKERISRLLRMHADKKEEIKEVTAGDIAAAVGLENTITGDTLGEEKKPWLLETISFAKPVISQAIEPKTNRDKDKLRDALEKLKIQDPSLHYRIEQETGQIILEGMGELHLEVSAERLRREYNVDIERREQKVSYRETITKKLENVEGEYKKQTGGSGHFARVKLTFEPNEGRGFEFVDAKKGQEMSNKDAEEVKEGIEEAMSSGLLLNYPLLDIKVTLLEGKRHEVDTKPGDFKNAAILAFRGDGVEEKNRKVAELGVVLLEPIMQAEVTTPKESYGETLASLTSQRGVINEVTEKDERTYIIHAHVPLSNILGYTTTLRSLTGGKGIFNMKLSHYQKVPKDVLTEIIKKEKVIA